MTRFDLDGHGSTLRTVLSFEIGLYMCFRCIRNLACGSICGTG